LLHRGYTAYESAGVSPGYVSECPFDFYKEWITDPDGARKKSEAVTRTTTKPPGD
jgi:amidase